MIKDEIKFKKMIKDEIKFKKMIKDEIKFKKLILRLLASISISLTIDKRWNRASVDGLLSALDWYTAGPCSSLTNHHRIVSWIYRYNLRSAGIPPQPPQDRSIRLRPLIQHLLRNDLNPSVRQSVITQANPA